MVEILLKAGADVNEVQVMCQCCPCVVVKYSSMTGIEDLTSVEKPLYKSYVLITF